MYSACKLNKQGDNIQPWCTPFPIWNQSVVPCPVLTVASWPAYRFLKNQVRWSGIPISFRIFHSFLLSSRSRWCFLELSCFFNDPVDVGNLMSGFSAFSKTRLNIRKFTVHVLLKPGLENFKHYFTSMWDECNFVVVWEFFDIAFLWDWNENLPFPVLWPLLSFPNLLAVWITLNWEILPELGLPDHLTCLPRNLYAVQEAKVRTGYGTTDWFNTGKGVC